MTENKSISKTEIKQVSRPISRPRTQIGIGNNFERNRRTLTAFGTDLTSNGLSLTYSQNFNSLAGKLTYIPFSEFDYGDFTRTADIVGYMLGRNYFEPVFVPLFPKKEFMSTDFDYDFKNFGIRNATEDEIIIY